MSSTRNAKKMAALIRRHATVFDIKRKALAAASIRPDEVRVLFAYPSTIHGKPRHQLRALFVVSNSHARELMRCLWGLGGPSKDQLRHVAERSGKANGV